MEGAEAVDDTRDRPSLTLQAQWALWGKAATDTEYRVLGCSKGTFDASHFASLIARYSPGTLDTVPQTTVSWVRDNSDSVSLAIAMHETVNPHRPGRLPATDAAGRPIVYVRYFAIAYDDLAEHEVGYRELAEGLRGCQLPPGSSAPVTFTMPRLEPPKGSVTARDLAERTAAVLLTNRPVCVLGAGATSPWARLWFIDTVMSLLPYGLRTNMSAATWANSTTQEHKLRLFFASHPRPRSDDTVAQWNRPASLAIEESDDPDALAYLTWLQERPWAPMRLAKRRERMSFRREDVRELIVTLPYGEHDDLTADEVLKGMGEALLAGDVKRFLAYLNHLRRRYGSQTAAIAASQEVDRDRCREVMKKYGLLGSQPLIPPEVRAEFKAIALRLGFYLPLTYPGYLQLEECAGRRLADDRELLDLLKGTVLDKLLWVLVRKEGGASTDSLVQELGGQRDIGGELLRELDQDARQAKPVIRADHGRQLFEVSVQHLFKYHPECQRELREIGYAAPIVRRFYADDRPGQRDRLVPIVAQAHAAGLDRQAIVQILNAPGRPPDALLSAVLSRAGGGDSNFALQTFAKARIADLNPHASILTSLLPPLRRRRPDVHSAALGWMVAVALTAFLICLIAAGAVHF
jgi:hypothetical protein